MIGLHLICKIVGMSTISQPQKLSDLRAAMEKAGVDGYLIPRADEFQGENVPPSSDRLRWLSGFTGSAGMAIVLKDKAVVMSDGRYTIQLKQQVDAALFGTEDSTKISPPDWIAEHAPDAVIGYDPKLHTPQELKKFEDNGVRLQPVSNLVDDVWKDRPAPPSAAIELFPLRYAGVEAKEKLDQVADILRGQGADAAIITMPDSIAWMLNIRSSDIAHTPVALSNAIVRKDGTLDWFIEAGRVSEAVQRSFGNRVSLVDPDAIEKSISGLKGKKVVVDGRRSSVWFIAALKKHGVDFIDAKDPSIALKARKNTAEQNAMRAAHIRDGVTMVKFLKWLDENDAPLDELAVEAKLESFRREAKEFKDSSFDTISGFGPNGAIVHYRANEKSNLKLEQGNLLLLDSGAQYEDGTTDITRTIAIGEPTKEMREMNTLVLKGHIAVATAKFPKGTLGKEIDALARKALQERGYDYAHGTGHGVGCYLSVHEEAASLSPRGVEPIEAGMIVSNEPGFYKEGAFGIRIENLVLTKEEDGLLSFETLTLAPMDLSLVEFSMLNSVEKDWLNDYQARVYATLAPLLDAPTREWLKSSMSLRA